MTLIVAAEYTQWTKVRANNAMVGSVTETRAQIRDDFADGDAKQMRHWITKIPTEPDIATHELSKSTCGCKYLLGQLDFLDERLDAYFGLDIDQRREALRYAGHRPEEVLSDRFVFDFNRAYFGGISGTNGFTSEEAGNALMHDRPKGMLYEEFVRRMEPLVKDIPSHAEGHRRLKAHVATERARLKERKELVGYREERRLKAALATAQSPTDRQGTTWMRYIANSDRTYIANMRQLVALQKDRRENGDFYNPAGSAEPAAEPAGRCRGAGPRGGRFPRSGGRSGGCDPGRNERNSEQSRGAGSRWPGRG